MSTNITQLSDKQINACTKCGCPGEFGYKIKGEMQWLCEQHRLSQNYADARAPAQSTSLPSWRQTLRVHPAADFFPPLSEPELKELADDIKSRGLFDPPSLYRDPELGFAFSMAATDLMRLS